MFLTFANIQLTTSFIRIIVFPPALILSLFLVWKFFCVDVRDHPIKTYAQFTEKLTTNKLTTSNQGVRNSSFSKDYLHVLNGWFLTTSQICLLYSSLYISDVFSANAKSYFELFCFILTMSSFDWFWKLLLTFWNFILLVKSLSNEIISLIYG